MNLFEKLLYGGSSRLTQFEMSLFDSLLVECSKDISGVLKLQFENIRIIQKFHNNSVIGYHLNRDFNTLLPDRRLDLTFCEFKYVLGGSCRKSKLVISAGVISSLETKGGLLKSELMQECVECSCKILNARIETLSESIDQIEHGTE